MLQILNERTFRNDATIQHCPLKLCVAASNEWPGDQEGGRELGALFDRFLMRKVVRPVGSEKSRDRLLWDADLVPKLSTTLYPSELAQATAEALALSWTPEAKAALTDILRESKREGIVVGDRRARKSVRAAQAFAWLNGAAAVDPEHLEILGHILWDDPAEQPRKLAEIVGRIANPSGMKINSLLMEAEQIIAGVNLKNLSEAATATKKLGEVAKQLKGISGHRATQAHDYIRDEVKRIKLATIDVM